MHHSFLGLPLADRLFKDARVIPIAGIKEKPGILKSAFTQIAEALSMGEIVCIFPEGKLTGDGEIGELMFGAPD
jgi:1-acyl-sn-glycerol-3-phosphate acyltransferase